MVNGERCTGRSYFSCLFQNQNKNERNCDSAAASAFLGITEPAIFGVNLKLGKPFIAAAIGGAIGGAYVVWMQVAANAYGLTGIPMLTIVAPLGMMNMIHYIIGFAIAVITLLLPHSFYIKKVNNNGVKTYVKI